MATALNTIEIMYRMHVPDHELEKITSQFGAELERLQRVTTNKYLLKHLSALSDKWNQLERSDKNNSFLSSPELESYD